MAMATRQAPAVTSLTASCYTRCLFFFIITVAAVSTPALAGSSPPPSTFVLYGFQYADTLVEVASPSGNLSANEFGSSIVIAIPLRETPAADSLVVGTVTGPVILEKDLSFYAANTYMINTGNFTGSILAQGILDSNGDGEVAITGGTYDFHFVRGYIDLTVVFSDEQVEVVKFVKYD